MSDNKNIGLIFPGQGSQVVGMLEKTQDIPAVKRMLQDAQEILGYDLLDLCLKGSPEKLKQTEFCQPALFVAGLAAVEQLRETSPDKAQNIKAVAGFSLGEVTALVASGALGFQDGLKFVNLRAKAMNGAANAGGKQLMVSCVGLTKDKLNALIMEAKGQLAEDVEEDKKDTVILQIANELFSTGFSVSGSEDAVNKLAEAVKESGAMANILPTGGAFHSPFMQPAVKPLTEAVDEFSHHLQQAHCDIYSNVTAKPYEVNEEGLITENFINLLPRQIVSPVLWSTLIDQMIQDGVTEFIECGPGKQLKSMMRRINMEKFKTTLNVEP